MKNRLREILKQRGVKQRCFARKADVSYSMLRRIIVDCLDTSVSKALKIARALDLKVEEIFTLDEVDKTGGEFAVLRSEGDKSVEVALCATRAQAERLLGAMETYSCEGKFFIKERLK